jgi:hypothetical protein
MTVKLDQPAKVEVFGYTVRCPNCKEPIKSPASLMGRITWLVDEFELVKRGYCPGCDASFPLPFTPCKLSEQS